MPSFEDKVTLSFGRYLQAIRLEKAISLEVVSKETRIRKDMLALIEEENHNKLPDEVFVKGFIRAYAEAIGADGDEAVRRYNSRLQVVQKICVFFRPVIPSFFGDRPNRVLIAVRLDALLIGQHAAYRALPAHPVVLVQIYA